MTSLSARFLAEAGEDFDPVVFSNFVRILVDNPEGFAEVMVVEGLTVGVFLGALEGSPISSRPIAREVIWWVKREYRNRGAVKMLNNFLSWSKSANPSKILLSAHDDRAGALYRRKGARKVETVWVI